MTLFERVFGGNDAVYGLTEAAVDAAIAANGEEKAVSFPDTAYALPCYYAVTGVKVTNLKEMKEALGVVKSLMTRENQLNDVFMSGVATALCAEFIEAIKYIDGAKPYDEPCYGHLSDAIIRELGVPLVTGDIPGVAVILGSAPTAQEGVDLVKSYQAQGILVTLVGGIIDQCQELGYKTGANVRVIPLGKDVTSVIHAVSVAIRAALIFGNVTAGDAGALMTYTKDRVPAFVNAFAPLDDVIVACGAGAIALGFPVITNDDKDVPAIPKSLIIQKDVSKFNATSLEARDIKIKITNIDIPVAFASAFEGEIIRRGDMQVEFDGSRVDCCELVQTKDASEVEDHKIELIGPDIDEFEVGSKHSIAYVVEVAGKSMQPDFEPVFERKFHSYLNCIEGVMHTGQRDMIRIRVSKEAFNAGFRAKHFGEVLYAQVKNEFEAVVDKCQVKIYTNPEDCTKIRHEIAIPVFDKRDERLSTMTDESVPVYYSCIMCQAFSPSHVCVVTPERLGLCGAVSWLDAKATNELDPQGPCQVITKERVIDENLGRYIGSKLPEKNFIYNDGFCHVHRSITAENVKKAKEVHPEAEVLVHPECTPDVVALGDYVGSTSGIIDYATASDKDVFIICTEMVVLYELKQKNPGKTFYSVGHRQFCPNMKRISLENVRDTLRDMKNQVELPEDLRLNAKKALDEMLRIAQ